MPLRLSVLDLSPVPSGSSSGEALRNTLDLAAHADRLGYTRYWLAEHHSTPLIASSVPEIMIAQVAGVTRNLRVGSGGVMLPNHAPLRVAEAFRMLGALYPGRIDLGIGRAPGTNQMTALALRRSRAALSAEDFPEQLAELLAFLSNGFPPGHPFEKVRAVPIDAPNPEIWLLGSSDFSARLAADLGLAFAFAHHINPLPVYEALRLYHERFRPSSHLEAPRAILTVSAICAETEEQAERLASSADLALLRFQKGDFRSRLASVEEAEAYSYTPFDRELIRQNRARLFVGTPDSLARRLSEFASETGVEELMVTSMIHDHQARRRSYELLAHAFDIKPSVES